MVFNIKDGILKKCKRKENITEVTVPDGVTAIESWAFYDCHSLRSITLPDSLTEIGNLAFGGCVSLADITLPDGLRKVSGSAFFTYKMA